MDQVVALSDRTFSRWTALLETRTGVCVTPAWEDHVRRGLVRQLRNLGDSDARPVGSVDRWWQALLENVLIRETGFFRHRPSFDFLAQFLRSRTHDSPTGLLNLWSAGCATGEEAYSMAITAAQHLPVSRFQVLASDISEVSLAQAERGVYARTGIAGLTAEEQAEFDTVSDQRVAVAQALRDRVQCRKINLVDEQWPDETGGMDIIFCQHVLVYFGDSQRKALVERLAGCLKPGGCLVLAPGEYLSRPVPGLQRQRADDVLVFVRTESDREC